MAIQLPEGPFKPNWNSLSNYRVPDWYQNDKFGIFIHWGVYAVPAYGSEWYPRNMYQQGAREFAITKRPMANTANLDTKTSSPCSKRKNTTPTTGQTYSAKPAPALSSP